MTSAGPSSPYPGVFLLPIPLTGSPLGQVNAYLLTSPDGHLLIDTGWNTEQAFETLEGHLKALGVHWGDLATMVITHAHLDHFGLVRRLRELSGARLGMHHIEARLNGARYDDLIGYAQQTADRLRRGGLDEDFMGDAGEFIKRFEKLSAQARPDFTLGGGEVISQGDFSLEILWTPGHSPGHICLYERHHKLLFSGDHVLPNISPNIGLFPQGGDNPLGDYLTSLRGVENLAVDLVLPAHGQPFAGLGQRVGQLREHHAQRNQELLDLLARSGEPATPFQLVGGITWHAGGRAVGWGQLSSFDQRLAMFEVMAHLEAMVREGSLQRVPREERLQYQLA